ncbi:hypothetical protein E5S70_37205 [Ensifer adhaerens]|nr:hypothetical protein [Ensifer canadensis]
MKTLKGATMPDAFSGVCGCLPILLAKADMIRVSLFNWNNRRAKSGERHFRFGVAALFGIENVRVAAHLMPTKPIGFAASAKNERTERRQQRGQSQFARGLTR